MTNYSCGNKDNSNNNNSSNNRNSSSSSNNKNYNSNNNSISNSISSNNTTATAATTANTATRATTAAAAVAITTTVTPWFCPGPEQPIVLGKLMPRWGISLYSFQNARVGISLLNFRQILPARIVELRPTWCLGDGNLGCMHNDSCVFKD